MKRDRPGEISVCTNARGELGAEGDGLNLHVTVGGEHICEFK